MSVTSGFFNSLNGDRKYNAQQMSALFDGLINDGVFATIGSAFEINATAGNNLTIGIGRAWFNHVWVYNDALLPIVIDDSEMILNRIDAIVIEINNTEDVREGRILIIRGTPASDPVRPTLIKEDGVYQYPLAYVNVRAGSSSITQADITNMVGSGDTPYVTGILEVRDIENIVAQWESQFIQWMDSLEDILDGDVAANLANRILELEEQFQDLVRDKSLYDTIDDSTDDPIKDSNGFEIQGRVSFEASFGGGSSSEEEEGGDEPLGSLAGFEVGDILTTVRNNLGPKWLLCNGQTIERDMYPTLANIYAFNPNEVFAKNDEIFPGTDARVTHAIYANGYYVVLGTYTNDSDIEKAAIAYSQTLNGEWTVKDLCTIETNGGGAEAFAGQTYGLVYGNGMYAALVDTGEYSSERANKVYMFYSPTLDGTWTEIQSGTAKHDTGSGSVTWSYPTGFNFINGYFIKGQYLYNNYGGSSYVPTFSYATSPNGPWTSKKVYTGSGYPTTGVTNDIQYANGMYALVYNGGYAYCESLDGTWTRKTISGFNTPIILRYVNSMWILMGLHYIDNDSSAGVETKLAYASEITGEWTVLTIEGPTYTAPEESVSTIKEFQIVPYPFDIIYYKGFYMALVQGCIYESSSISGSFDTPIYLMYSNTLNGPWMFRYFGHLGSVEEGIKEWLYGIGDLYWNSPYGSGSFNPYYVPHLYLLDNGEIAIASGPLSYLETSKITLPNISLDSAYSYIKVEE